MNSDLQVRERALVLDDLPTMTAAGEQLISLRHRRERVESIPIAAWAHHGPFTDLAAIEHLLTPAERKDMLGMMLNAINRAIEAKEQELQRFGVDPTDTRNNRLVTSVTLELQSVAIPKRGNEKAGVPGRDPRLK